MTYLSARRPVKTTAIDCEIRGGEYVAQDRADYQTALKVWLAQAEQGDPVAQTYVGEIYEKGLGGEPQYDLAAVWFGRAAAQGHPRARMNLGYLYEQGLGVPRDPVKALNLYREATGLQEDISLDQSDLLRRQREELDTLRKELDTRERQIETLRRQLQETRGEGDRARRDLETSRKEIEAERRALAKARSELKNRKAEAPGAAETGLGPLQQEILRRENALTSRKQESERLNLEVARLDRKVGEYRNRLAELQKRLDVLPGPRIEIIQPRVLNTRGLRMVPLGTGAKKHRVLGMIDAPAGVAGLLVNGKQEQVEPGGLFQAWVPAAPSGSMDVVIVARDSQGKTDTVRFTIHTRGTAPRKASGRREDGQGSFGRYHALLIGNDNYQKLPKLGSAVNDVQAIAALLRDHYGFEVRVLTDATRGEILSALDDYRKNLTEEDSLLVYYAGHGELDAKNKRGYWLPVDADPENYVNAIANYSVTDILNNMAARHTLIIADTCYAGILTGSIIARPVSVEDGVLRQDRLARISEGRSRTVMSSGNLMPVLDTAIGGHSVFAGALLDVLGSNEEVMEGSRLHDRMKTIVSHISRKLGLEQTPRYAANLHAGHVSGDFLFIPVENRKRHP